MLALSTKQKRWIILIIFILSGYTGYRFSGGLQMGRQKDTVIDTRKAETVFENANNYRKTNISFTVEDFEETAAQFNEILAVDGVNEKHIERRGSSIIAVLEITEDVENNVMLKLTQLPGLNNQKTIQTPSQFKDRPVDVDSHIEREEMVLNRLQERLQSPHVTSREIDELHSRMRNIRTTIDSLKSIQVIEEERSKHLLMAVLRPTPPPFAGGPIRQIRNLIFYVGMSLIAYTIIAFLAYICFELLNKLMTVAGIKSAKTKSRYGSYKYGSYGGYGYSRKPKRKKRKVYVKRDEDEEEDSSDSDDS